MLVCPYVCLYSFGMKIRSLTFAYTSSDPAMKGVNKIVERGLLERAGLRQGSIRILPSQSCQGDLLVLTGNETLRKITNIQSEISPAQIKLIGTTASPLELRKIKLALQHFPSAGRVWIEGHVETPNFSTAAAFGSTKVKELIFSPFSSSEPYVLDIDPMSVPETISIFGKNVVELEATGAVGLQRILNANLVQEAIWLGGSSVDAQNLVHIISSGPGLNTDLKLHIDSKQWKRISEILRRLPHVFEDRGIMSRIHVLQPDRKEKTATELIG